MTRPPSKCSRVLLLLGCDGCCETCSCQNLLITKFVNTIDLRRQSAIGNGTDLRLSVNTDTMERQEENRRLEVCRSKCPKNNFDRTTSPASSHCTDPSVASHTLEYSLVPSHEPISSVVRTSYPSRVYVNHIARTGSYVGAPNIIRRTHLLLITDTGFPWGEFPPFPRDKLEVGGVILSTFRLFRGGFEALWPFFAGRKATELFGGDGIYRHGLLFPCTINLSL